MKKYILVFALIVISISALVSFSDDDVATKFHSNRELKALRSLPYGQNDLFAGSGLCAGCHGHDPNQLASIDESGRDVNVADDWASTMMGNSSKDPLWRAKVSHEILVNPAHQVSLENKCTSCHAPAGHFNAIHNGASTYAIADMIGDSIAMDGVNCGGCHQQKDTLRGKRFSGELIYDTTKTVYGPYANPFAGPMQSFVGFDVKQGAHVTDASFCAGCHTLQTETVDLAGNPTGNFFTEQATYHEWLNSDFNTDTLEDINNNGISCQGCHVPRINDKIIIAANYAFLQPRKPFGLHYFAGANTFMLQLLKNNITKLGLTATALQFDSTIARTNRMLQQQSLDMNLTEVSRTNDTVFYDLKLTNKAGHKFPSGYPSRRAFVEFVVMDDNGDTIFKTGRLDSNYELIGQDAVYEPHYDMINQESQVQIYEMVMGDVASNVTTVLERANAPLKDNRLTPKGFSTLHSAYDTTLIAGGALNDPDFNKNGVVEGTGEDIIHFHIPLAGYTGDLNVTAKFYYQSVPRRWLNEMFSFSSAEIDTFRNMFNEADHTPVLVDIIKMGSMFASVEEASKEDLLKIYPNPTWDGLVNLMFDDMFGNIKVEIFDLAGKLVSTEEVNFLWKQIVLPRKGAYILRIDTGKQIIAKKVLYL